MNSVLLGEMAHVPPQCCWGHGCPAEACGALLCRGHPWAVKLQWLEFLPSVWHLLSQPDIPPWLKCWSGLLHLVLCYPELQPQAHKKRGCVQDQRGALNAECYSGLPSSSWVISLCSTPKKAMFGFSRCCKQHCCENATLYTCYSTENQEPADVVIDSLYHLLQLWGPTQTLAAKALASFLENGPFLARSQCSFHKLTALFQETVQILHCSPSSFRKGSCLQH